MNAARQAVQLRRGACAVGRRNGAVCGSYLLEENMRAYITACDHGRGALGRRGSAAERVGRGGEEKSMSEGRAGVTVLPSPRRRRQRAIYPLPAPHPEHPSLRPPASLPRLCLVPLPSPRPSCLPLPMTSSIPSPTPSLFSNTPSPILGLCSTMPSTHSNRRLRPTNSTVPLTTPNTETATRMRTSISILAVPPISPESRRCRQLSLQQNLTNRSLSLKLKSTVSLRSTLNQKTILARRVTRTWVSTYHCPDLNSFLRLVVDYAEEPFAPVSKAGAIPNQKPNMFQRYFGLYPLSQRIEDKKRGVGVQRYPIICMRIHLLNRRPT